MNVHVFLLEKLKEVSKFIDKLEEGVKDKEKKGETDKEKTKK